MYSTFEAILFWLSERLRDAAMWPINLVRDFPIRAYRLLMTLWRGVKGVVFFFPEMGRDGGNGRLSPWLHYKRKRFFDWLHQLLTQLFDLVGGPEIAQFFMHLIGKTTPLTGEEIAMISSVLGPNAMRYGDIRVVEGGLYNYIFKMNGHLAFATWHSINLPVDNAMKGWGHTRQNRAIVVHELTHVYQYEQVGTRYLGEAIYMLIKTKRDCYNYGGEPGLVDACGQGKRYRDYNREQQAKITQDYFTLREQGIDVTSYEPFINQARAGEL
ncbi:MAG: hypothetical protein AAF614_28645 [Chloroflexota bacterium]